VVACDLFSGFQSAAGTLEGAVAVADAFHLVRYVDWVVAEYHHGHYGRFRAYLVAEEFGPRLEPAFKR
jgi:hypothetical protein